MTADIASVAKRIADVAGESARTEARWLIEAADGDATKLEDFVLRRLTREPVDRILGSRGFWTLDLQVTPDVLSPRSDTETVVRAVLDVIKERGATQRPLRILDLGAGSGAILLALLVELPNATGVGIDISPLALDVARKNAERNRLEAQAHFQSGDWAAGLDATFDIVVSNPPYICSEDIAGLDREVRDFDPHLALDGGIDGLDPYRIILSQISPLLSTDGFVAFEFGEGQGDPVAEIAASFGFRFLRFEKDFNEITRACILTKI